MVLTEFNEAIREEQHLTGEMWNREHRQDIDEDDRERSMLF